MPKSDNMRGAVLMMGSMAAFTLNDTLMKSLAGDMPLLQALFLRGLPTSLFLGWLAWRAGAFRRLPGWSDAGLIALRSGAEVAAAWLFLTALFNAPQANVTAILQALPLTVTLAAALFLGEPLGWRRLVAIAVGFAGVMLIVRPGLAGFTIWSLYALAAVVMVTLRDLAVRRMSDAVSSEAVAFAGAVGVAVAAGLGLWSGGAGSWVPVDGGAAALLAGAALFVIGGYLFSVMVMRVGEIGFVAPFRYTSLLWAVVLGFLVFGELPDMLTLAGSAIVVATGIYSFRRERLRARG